MIDADLQHPPEILPELLAPILLGRADICVGSRYRRGGSAAGLESRWRRLAARVSGAARALAVPGDPADDRSRQWPVRGAPRGARLGDTSPRGSRVLAEILVRARWRTVCDIPYRFAVTDDGDAHLGAAAAFALARELISLWRLDARLAGSERAIGARPRGANGLRDRRRVAPVHVELLRESAADGRRP